MIRLEGDTLPLEARGAIPPILFGDVLRDVPGIPLQIGWTALLATNCGVTTGTTTLYLGGPDLATVLEAVPSSGVVQLENEWMAYSSILTGPARLVITTRGFASTVAAVHAKGTTVYFVETRPLYVFAYTPPGCVYASDTLVQLRVNDNAETPPATVRLQDERVIPGVRLMTVEFDASHAFYAPPPPPLPSQVLLLPDPGTSLAGAAMSNVLRMGKTPGAPLHLLGFRGTVTGRMGSGGGVMHLAPPRPTLAAPSAPAPSQPFAGNGGQRRITLRQGGLGRVTADLRGLCDTVGGRYSGVASGRLTQPAAIVRLLLEESYGETDPARYHLPTWTATAARHVQRAITWRLVWQGDAFESFREAAQLCGQADLYLDDDDRWRYQFRDPLAPAVATLTDRELLESPALSWTAGRELVTELEVAWGEGLQAGTFTLDSPMRTRHGRNHGGLSLPYAASAAVARTLSAYQLTRRDRPRQTLAIRAAHSTLGLTLTDRIYVDTPVLDLYRAPLVPFEIVGITDRGDQRVFALLEGDPYESTATLSATLAGVTLVASGVVMASGGILGTLAKALAGVGLAAAGSVVGAGAISGTLTVTLGGVTLTVAVTLERIGTLATTLAGVTLAAAGTVATGGTFPTLGHVTTVGDTGTSTDTVQSFTTASDETFMVVCIGIRGGSMSTIGGVTFGATALTAKADQLDTSGNLRATMYAGAVSGSATNNVTVDYVGGNANAVVAIRAYKAVVSAGTAVAGFTNAGTSLAVTLSSVTNARCIDFIVTAFADNAPTLGAGQATEFTAFQDGGSQIKMAGSFENAETSMSWTGLNHANDDAVMIALPLVGV